MEVEVEVEVETRGASCRRARTKSAAPSSLGTNPNCSGRFKDETSPSPAPARPERDPKQPLSLSGQALVARDSNKLYLHGAQYCAKRLRTCALSLFLQCP